MSEVTKEWYNEGYAAGISVGAHQSVISLFHKGLISLSDAAKELGISEEEVEALLKAENGEK